MIIDKIKIGNQTYNVGARYQDVSGTPTKLSDFTNDEGFIDKSVNNLDNYTPSSQATTKLELVLDSSTFKLKGILKDSGNNVIFTSNEVDLPLETMVIGASYDSLTKEIVLSLQNGTTVRVSVADLVSGLVSTTDLQTALANYYTKSETNALLNAKQDIMQYSTMPTASADNLDKVAQYVGTTDNTYTNGYFYQVISDGETTPTYSWENIKVQSGGGEETIDGCPVYDIYYATSSDTTYGSSLGSSFQDQITEIANKVASLDTSVYTKFYLRLHKVIYNSNYVCSIWCRTISSAVSPLSFVNLNGNYVYFESDQTTHYISISTYASYDSTQGKYICSMATVSDKKETRVWGTYQTNMTYANLSESQTISGLKTFSTLPQSSVTPTTDNQMVNKKYVDDNANPTIITNTDTTYTINSLIGNQTYKLSEITSLTINAITTFDKESIIYFESGDTATNVSIPDTLINLGDVPTLTTSNNISVGTCEANKNYIIAVLNNIAVWKAY